MFDFDVVSGPSDRAKPAPPEARRQQPPSDAAVPPTAMSGDGKDAAVADAADPPGLE
jgi:hypothetical protein